MERGAELLHKYAVARTAQGALYGEGTVVAYVDTPQVTIRRPDGSHFDWSVGMCTFEEREEMVQALPAGAHPPMTKVFFVPGSPFGETRLDADVQQIITLVYAMAACGADMDTIKMRLLGLE